MTMLKVKCSGAYLHGKEKVDFEEIITVPACDEEWLKSNIIHRTLPRHFFNKKNAKRFDANYSCYIDSVEEIDEEPTAIGKSISDLTHDEIQEVAIMYSLRRVPKYKGTDLRATKKILYREYCNKVLGLVLSEDFDFENAPDVTIGDASEENVGEAAQSVTKAQSTAKKKDKVAEGVAKLNAQLDEETEI
jgi:hypothetical protein